MNLNINSATSTRRGVFWGEASNGGDLARCLSLSGATCTVEIMSETCRTLGASVALVVITELGRRVLAVQRTNDPGIAFPGKLEFPGGGAEPNESAKACAIREFFEETGIEITEEMLVWQAMYPSARVPGAKNGFFVAEAREDSLPPLQLSDEAQAGGLMSPAEFCMSDIAIPGHVDHYVDYLRGVNGIALPISRQDLGMAA